MSLAQDMPWADAVTGDDPYATYASNLAGFEGLGGPENFPEYLGPMASTTPGFLAQTGFDPVVTEYADPDYEDIQGLEAMDWTGRDNAPLIGGLANALLGAMVVPMLASRFDQGAPQGAGMMLLGAAIGGFLGYRYPLPATLGSGAYLLADIL